MKERIFRDANVPDLDRLAKPLINYLQKHQHPNTSIIVSEKGIKMVEDLYLVPKGEYSDTKNTKNIFKRFLSHKQSKEYIENLVTSYEIRIATIEGEAFCNRLFARECLYMLAGIALVAVVGFLYVIGMG